MNKIFFGLIFSFLLALPVQLMSQSTSPLEAYAGNWKFTFDGGLKGDGNITISPDGILSVYISLGRYQHLFTNPVSLNVSENGALNGNIMLLGVRAGGVFGVFSSGGDLYGEVSTPFVDVGTVRGHLDKNSGKGTFQSTVGNGTWTARKM